MNEDDSNPQLACFADRAREVAVGGEQHKELACSGSSCVGALTQQAQVVLHLVLDERVHSVGLAAGVGHGGPAHAKGAKDMFPAAQPTLAVRRGKARGGEICLGRCSFRPPITLARPLPQSPATGLSCSPPSHLGKKGRAVSLVLQKGM